MEEASLHIQGQVSPEARERFDAPRNYGPLPECNGHARITGRCGDTMEFWVQVAENRIVKAGFTTTGCGPSRAAGSMATELAIGRELEDAMDLQQAEILNALGGLPQESEHCALLAATTLRAAVDEYCLRRRGAQERDCQQCSSQECPSKDRQPEESEPQFADRQALARRMCRIGFKLLVMSGKGGVGKSTVAANLAVSLMLADKRVGLLDVDIHGPSIPRLMGLEHSRLAVHDGEIAPLEIGADLKIMSIGFLLDSDRASVIWRGPMKHGVIRQFLQDVAWGPLDYLVIDAPPGTGDEPLSVAQLVGQPAGAVLVTTPQDLSVADVRRSVSFCRKVELPIVGIVENMSGLVCPHCQGVIDLFKTGGGETLAQEMDVPFLGRIPIDPQVVACGDQGIPYVHSYRENAAAKAFALVAKRILAHCSTVTTGSSSRK